MENINIVVGDCDIQHIVEVVAALDLGNKRLNSSAVSVVRDIFMQALKADKTHYLFLRDPDDLASFFGCGSARGAADTMVEDGRTCRLYSIPKDECTNCREEDDDGDYMWR